MSTFQTSAEDLLAKCGRRCCICRRFAPTHLQVHHIKPKGEGGTDETENLIAICVTCHSDTHTETKLTRRFTARELKMHRDALLELMTQGKLSPPGEAEPVGELIEAVVRAVQGLGGTLTTDELDIPPESLELLLEAADNTGIIGAPVQDNAFGMSIEQVRSKAKLRHALEGLIGAGLAEHYGGVAHTLTYDGFLIADTILAAGRNARDEYLSARFRIEGDLDYTKMLQIVRLSGPGDYDVSGRVEITEDKAGEPVPVPGAKPWQHADGFLRHICGADISGKVKPSTTATLDALTKDDTNTTVVEQAQFNFSLDESARPCELEVIVGHEMPPEKRRALLDRLVTRLRTIRDCTQIDNDVAS